MIRGQILTLVFCAALLAGTGGCGYRLASSASTKMPAGQSLWVPFIVNESISPSAQTVIRRAMYEELHAARGLVPSPDQGSSDLRLTGRLASYSSRILSYSAADRAAEYRLTAEVELELRRRGEPQALWKGILQASADYPASSDLALQHNAEEAALDKLSRILAARLISAVEQDY